MNKISEQDIFLFLFLCVYVWHLSNKIIGFRVSVASSSNKQHKPKKRLNFLGIEEPVLQNTDFEISQLQ